MMHAPDSIVFWLTVSGIFMAFIAYILVPSIPSFFAKVFSLPYRILQDKYGFDSFNDLIFVRGGKTLGRFFYRVGDQELIDGLMVNGAGRTVVWFALKARLLQSGYLYHYVALMVISVFGFLCWLLLA
jgi:NADH-quinone oxidoreductase subunit L